MAKRVFLCRKEHVQERQNPGGDMLGTIFADPGAAQELLNNAPRSVLEKIRDFISELLDTISAAARRIAGAKELTALTELEG